jgi:class 3 adenylate cyclase
VSQRGEEDEEHRPEASDAESRFVTLLKFDLVGSTEISDALSASDELDVKRAYVSAVERLVRPEQVKIEWEGDGGLLVFGYPVARVDAAEAAVRAGLRLIEAVQSVDVVRGVSLQIRAGVASGRVTVDKTRGSLSRVKPVSRAARLMVKARPGQLLIADDTLHLVKRFFEYEDLGVIELQGAGPRHVWRVLGETAVVSRFDAQHFPGSQTEIVGRQDALAELALAWAGARAGQGAAICLVGDSGIGKSRLARAVLDWARRDAAGLLEIDCTPSTGNTPLLPIGVLLRTSAGIGRGASEADQERSALALLTRVLGEAEARDVLKYLAPLFGIESAPIPLDKTREQVRAATIAAIVGIVRAYATMSPLAILCEDLHWADDTTAQVVQAIAEIARTMPVLLIVTRWPKPVTGIDFDAITAACTTVTVEPLPAENAADLVRAVAGGGLSRAEVDDIVSRCGGVPLLLEEVTRCIVERADAGAAARAAHSSESAVPPELQLVVESRLEQWHALRGIVEAASVLGREFPVPLLEAMVPGRAGEVSPALAQLAEQGLFAPRVPGGSERASFRHVLIRDAVYETLVSREHLRRLHARAADALMSRFQGTPDAPPDVLAQHLLMAGRLDEAIRIRLGAADDTFNRGAYVEAMGHCRAVRELFDQVADPVRVKADAFRLCVLLGMVGAGLHGYSSAPAEAAYREAHGMFDAETGAEQRYPVIRGLALAALVRGELATAYRYSLEVLDLAERSGRPDYRIDSMSVVAYTTLYHGRLEDCRVWIDRCLELYDAEGGARFRYPVPQDPKTAALALLPTVAWLLGDVEGAEAAIARGLHHVEELGRDFDRAMLHAWTAGTRYTQRRFAQAVEHAGIAHALGTAHRFQEWEGIGGMMALISQCALTPAPALLEQAIATAEAFKSQGVGLNASYFLWGIARGYAVAGHPEIAQALLQAALTAARDSGETRMNPEIWMLQAEIESEGPRQRELLLQAFKLADSQGAAVNALRAAAMFAARSPDAGDIAWGQVTLERLDGGCLAPAGPRWITGALAEAARRLQD